MITGKRKRLGLNWGLKAAVGVCGEVRSGFKGGDQRWSSSVCNTMRGRCKRNERFFLGGGGGGGSAIVRIKALILYPLKELTIIE